MLSKLAACLYMEHSAVQGNVWETCRLEMGSHCYGHTPNEVFRACSVRRPGCFDTAVAFQLRTRCHSKIALILPPLQSDLHVNVGYVLHSMHVSYMMQQTTGRNT